MSVESNLPPLELIDDVLERRRWQLRAKRLFDVVMSSVLLVVVAPFMIIVAIAIRLDSPGRAVFSQPRWGWKERQFRFYKFRTMDVDRAKRDVGEGGNGGAGGEFPSDGSLRKQIHDPRVTRVGRFLRRTSVDELPQLWNVLRGDMSLVGPRPLMLHMLEPYPALRRLRCKLRPGLTGLWQVSDREHNTHVASMARWDMQYLERVGVLLDGKILMRTFGAIVTGRGAV